MELTIYVVRINDLNWLVGIVGVGHIYRESRYIERGWGKNMSYKDLNVEVSYIIYVNINKRLVNI